MNFYTRWSKTATIDVWIPGGRSVQTIEMKYEIYLFEGMRSILTRTRTMKPAQVRTITATVKKF